MRREITFIILSSLMFVAFAMLGINMLNWFGASVVLAIEIGEAKT